MSAAGDLIAGRYRLVNRVGRGGMGVVWEAWDERLHRRVAVKQLHTQPGLGEAESELANLRAMREARITARLDHPHAVPVFDVVEHEGQPCLIMQFLPSTPLSDVLRDRHTLPLTETARIGAQIASALAAAHRVGIVHRDVKPGNVLLADDGTARISDFGISHALGDSTLTATGMVHGTPAYLAPEVARGGDSTFASDVFGLGATLYTAREGEPPFGKDMNSIALLYKVASGNFTPPTRSGTLTPVMLRMLSPDPQERPDMGEVARTLTALAAASGAEPETLRFAEADVATVASDVTRSQRPWTRGAPVAQDPPATPAPAPVVAPPPSPRNPPEDSTAPPVAAVPIAAAPAAAVDGRRRGLVWALLAVAALLGIAALGYAFAPELVGRRPMTAATPPGASPPASSAPASAEQSPAAPSSPSEEPSSAEESSAGKSPSASESRSATRSADPSPSSEDPDEPKESKSSKKPDDGETPDDNEPTADELAEAITSYYARMPNDTDEGWDRLTSSYQQGRARSRATYERFWGGIDRVSVSRVSADPPNRVVATVTYVYKSGRTVRERTSYRLRQDDGELKINSSTVVSSSTL